jgi:hypothetical protein
LERSVCNVASRETLLSTASNTEGSDDEAKRRLSKTSTVLDAAFVAMGATKAAEERMVQAAAINSGPVIYLTGVGGTSHNNSSHTNPKLCYSNVNVAASNSDEEVLLVTILVDLPLNRPLLSMWPHRFARRCYLETRVRTWELNSICRPIIVTGSQTNEILVDPQVDDPIEMLFASLG